MTTDKAYEATSEVIAALVQHEAARVPPGGVVEVALSALEDGGSPLGLDLGEVPGVASSPKLRDAIELRIDDIAVEPGVVAHRVALRFGTDNDGLAEIVGMCRGGHDAACEEATLASLRVFVGSVVTVSARPVCD